jgi:SAM-dependent methyltransferase
LNPENSVGRRWEQVAAESGSAYRETLVPQQEISNLLRSPYVQAVIERTGPDGLCLETGCGSGKLSLALAATGRKAVALDISGPILKNLARNRTRLSDRGWPIGIRGEIEKLPFDDGTFDAVFSEGVIEHWIEKAARAEVLREMARVLKPGGALVLFVPNGRHPLHGWWQRMHYPGYASEDRVPWHRFNSAELAQELSELGLANVEHDGISPWSTLAIWPNWLPLRALAALCRRIFPAPIGFRRKFGFNLMAVGTKN